MLFAGGCHVDGYLVGEKCSFVAESLGLLARMGWQFEARTLACLTLTHPERLVALCGNYKPEVLVLQLGNWETNAGFRQYLRKQSGFASSSVVGTSKVEGAPLSFRPGLRWHAKSRVRQVLDLILGHPLVNLEWMQKLLNIFFTEVAALKIPAVLVLSPLPCLDPVHRFYRQRLLPVFEAEVSKHGFPYLDVFNLYGRDGRAHADDLFADAGHLNIAGHHWLGEVVGHRIHSLMARELHHFTPPQHARGATNLTRQP
jgi:hypothetical protein